MSSRRCCGPRAIKLAESQGRAFGTDNRGPLCIKCCAHANHIADRRRLGRNAVQRQAGIHRLKIARDPAPRKYGAPSRLMERPEMFFCGGGQSGRETADKGNGITSRTFTYSNVDRCSVIRSCYDSHINMIARITCNPTGILSFDINQAAATFCFISYVQRWRS
jgi:hypothetical protein